MSSVEAENGDFAPALLFENVSFTIEKRPMFRCPPLKKVQLPIIKDCSGIINRSIPKRGEVVAILGSSGAGKSTLLDVLAKRKTFGKIEGNVLYNGKVLKTRHLATNIAGYVRQEDFHIASLTVKQTLMYAADLRCYLMPERAKREKVHQLINALSLTGAAESQVGNQLKRGISGGEARRLSIGVEMLNDPDILFLDEPTSGLDSSSSSNVITILKKLVRRRNSAAICTIHQPSREVFEMFDKIILLTKTEAGFGAIVYTGSPLNVSAYFSRLGHGCPPRVNPADHMIQCCSIKRDEAMLNLLYGDKPVNDNANQKLLKQTKGESLESRGEMEDSQAHAHAHDDDDDDDEEEGKSRVQHFYQSYLVSPENQEVISSVEKCKGSPPFHRDTNWEPLPFHLQCITLIRRKYQEIYNDRPMLISKFVIILVLAAILSTAYRNLSYSQEDVTNRVSLIFFMLLTSYLASEPFFALVAHERILTAHEKGAKLYSTLVYVISTSVGAVPIQVLCGFLYVTIVYWSTNLRATFAHYAIFFIEFTLLTLFLIYYALALGALTPNVEAAMGVSAIVFSIMLLFCGFLLITSSIPSYWIWANWSSVFKYALYVALDNEFRDVQFPCGSNCTNSFSSGNQLLSFYGVDNSTLLWPYMAVTLGYAGVCALLFYLFLRFIHYEKR